MVNEKIISIIISKLYLNAVKPDSGADIEDSQNRKTFGVGWDLQGSSSPTLK